MAKKLIFIYNAKSGVVSSFLNTAHKIISPKTYKCSLCKLTHDDFSEKKDWKDFRENSDILLEFYHSDEYILEDNSVELPLVLLENEGLQDVFMSTTELNQFKDINELIAKISSKIRDCSCN